MEDQPTNSKIAGDENQSIADELGATERPAELAGCQTFDPSQLEREMKTDRGARWLLIAGLILLCLPTAASALSGRNVSEPAWFSSLMIFVIVAWIWVSTNSARIARQLGSIAALVDQNPSAADGLLAASMTKRPIQRSVRLMLYHRLALVRHRQMRFFESAAICQELLSQPLSTVQKARTSLLLIQTESLLHLVDVSGAYGAISQLHSSRLRLADRLQLLPLQVRYEIMVDQNETALRQVRERVCLAELMPSFQCGAVHAMLAIAAERADRTALADWLNARAALLSPAEDDEDERKATELSSMSVTG